VDLYLIRHAEARALDESRDERDEDRPLTEEGEAQARRIATGLHQRGIRVAGALLTSPLLRARQTAEGMLGHWPDFAPRIQECEELAPGVKPKKLARYLRSLGTSSLSLVGHMPDLAEFLGWLIGSRKAQIDMAKAGVAYVTCDDVRKRDGTLEWLVTPEWFE
jgi:phosphohistidine phosphatase SixA